MQQPAVTVRTPMARCSTGLTHAEAIALAKRRETVLADRKEAQYGRPVCAGSVLQAAMQAAAVLLGDMLLRSSYFSSFFLSAPGGQEIMSSSLVPSAPANFQREK